ncbi:MAG TPA: exodeoxyribonuclease III, partial [Candidatus Limnocylindrales bacterium]
MRIATWNVNSLKARQEAVELWLAKAEPDVLLIQETKLSDADAPVMPLRMLGYEVAHHGEGRWNGVAILSRVGIEDVITNFGDGPVRDSSARPAVAAGEDDFNPLDEARMLSAVCGGVRVASLYVPNGREVGSAFFEGKLRWFDRLSRWLAETRSPDEPLVL